MSQLSDKFQLLIQVYLLVVLDVVHDLGNTSLMVLEEGGGHNWVQAVEGKCSVFFV